MKILFLLFGLLNLFFSSSTLLADENSTPFLNENSAIQKNSSDSQTDEDKNDFISFSKEESLPILHMGQIIQTTDTLLNSIATGVLNQEQYSSYFSKEEGRSNAYETEFGHFQILSCESGTLEKSNLFLGLHAFIADGWQLSKPVFFPQSVENVQKTTPFFPFSPTGQFTGEVLFPIVVSLKEASQPVRVHFVMKADACSEKFGCQTLVLPFFLSLSNKTNAFFPHCMKMKLFATSVPLRLLPADSHFRFQKQTSLTPDTTEKDDFDRLSVLISCPEKIKEAELFFYDKNDDLLQAEITSASFAGSTALLHVKPFFNLSAAKKVIAKTDKFLYEKDFVLEENGQEFSLSYSDFWTFENIFIIILSVFAVCCGLTLRHIKKIKKQTDR
jgi:hypothetical protein